MRAGVRVLATNTATCHCRMLLRQVGGLKRSAPDADASIGGVTGAETAHLPLTEPAAAAAAAVGVHGATVWPDPAL